MTMTTWAYIIYIILSLWLTIWVARTLFLNGKAFLLEAFQGNEALANSVNHLLVVGFYLVNAGFIMMFLRARVKPEDLESLFELLSGKMAWVLLILGMMHFMNLIIFTKLRKGALKKVIPPVIQQELKA